MAEVTIEISGRNYTVACKDGGEDHLRSIATLVDAKAKQAQRSAGGVNEVRNLLFASILLADELNDIKTGGALPSPPPAPVLVQENVPDISPIIEKLAARVELLAEKLENAGSSA